MIFSVYKKHIFTLKYFLSVLWVRVGINMDPNPDTAQWVTTKDRDTPLIDKTLRIGLFRPSEYNSMLEALKNLCGKIDYSFRNVRYQLYNKQKVKIFYGKNLD
jgi:hypothetical protein